MKVYDNYQISPCKRFEESDAPGRFYFEVCEPQEADVWTLYGHLPGEGVEAIGDFATREAAEETFRRITGIPFGSASEVAPRLRVIRAGQQLLEAAKQVLANWESGNLATAVRALAAAAEQATSGTPSESRQPITIEIRGGVVQDVRNIPPGYSYEIADWDDRSAGEESAGRSA